MSSSSNLFYLLLVGLLCAAVYSHSAEENPHEACVHDSLSMADDMVKAAQGGLKCAGEKTEHKKSKATSKSADKHDHSAEEDIHESFLKKSLHEAEDLTIKAAETAQKIVQNPIVKKSSGLTGGFIYEAAKFVINVVRAMSRDEVA